MIILAVNPKNSPQAIKKAVNHLVMGGIVAAKADTSYALLVLPKYLENHRILNIIKHSRHGKQYSLFVAKPEDIVSKVDDKYKLLVKKMIPGAVTIIYDIDKPALRHIDSPTINSLLTAIKSPLTATSANPSNRTPAVSVGQVREYFQALPVLVLDEGDLPTQKPSTIIDLSGKRPRVVRRGAVSLSRVNQ